VKRRLFFCIIAFLLSLPLIGSCTKVPVTNRTQLNFVPDKWIRWISDKYYYFISVDAGLFTSSFTIVKITETTFKQLR